MEDLSAELLVAMKMTQNYFSEVVVAKVVDIIYDISLQNFGLYWSLPTGILFAYKFSKSIFASKFLSLVRGPIFLEIAFNSVEM